MVTTVRHKHGATQSHLRCIFLFLGVTLAASGSSASANCEIVDKAEVYYERKEVAIMLMQYHDLVLRATDGKIRCMEDEGAGRLVCLTAGKAEILIEGAQRAPAVVRLTRDEPSEVQLYSTGDLACGLQTEFKRDQG